ncbi:hypothetical protein TNCV_2223151 [Trichonephila clavipes]|nr:hypothetical protein TNCV_2223151 [Trichonephila clavipes]
MPQFYIPSAFIRRFLRFRSQSKQACGPKGDFLCKYNNLESRNHSLSHRDQESKTKRYSVLRVLAPPTPKGFSPVRSRSEKRWSLSCSEPILLNTREVTSCHMSSLIVRPQICT